MEEFNVPGRSFNQQAYSVLADIQQLLALLMGVMRIETKPMIGITQVLLQNCLGLRLGNKPLRMILMHSIGQIGERLFDIIIGECGVALGHSRSDTSLSWMCREQMINQGVIGL